MNLLRSICCLFAGGCGAEEPESTKKSRRGESSASEGDLGQTEAELEKTGKEQMSHLEGVEKRKASH